MVVRGIGREGGEGGQEGMNDIITRSQPNQSQPTKQHTVSTQIHFYSCNQLQVQDSHNFLLNKEYTYNILIIYHQFTKKKQNIIVFMQASFKT